MSPHISFIAKLFEFLLNITIEWKLISYVIVHCSPLITHMLASLTSKWVIDTITHVTLNTTNNVIFNFGVYVAIF